MKQYRKARELAEAYVFGNKKHLTSTEIELIKTSPFNNILPNNSEATFIKLAESYLDKLNGEKVEKSSASSAFSSAVSKSNRYYSGIDRNEIVELIRSIEDEFNLGVPYDYFTLSAEKLKEFIKKYSERHIFDEQTKALVLKIAEFEHPEQIMGGLRVNIGR